MSLRAKFEKEMRYQEWISHRGVAQMVIDELGQVRRVPNVLQSAARAGEPGPGACP